MKTSTIAPRPLQDFCWLPAPHSPATVPPPVRRRPARPQSRPAGQWVPPYGQAVAPKNTCTGLSSARPRRAGRPACVSGRHAFIRMARHRNTALTGVLSGPAGASGFYNRLCISGRPRH